MRPESQELFCIRETIGSATISMRGGFTGMMVGEENWRPYGRQQ
jgi:hypothetical protein